MHARSAGERFSLGKGQREDWEDKIPSREQTLRNTPQNKVGLLMNEMGL